MRRSVTRNAVVLCKSTSRRRYRCESVPIGLGYTGEYKTGWLTSAVSDAINPWGTSSSAVAIFNRAAIANTQARGIVECKLKMLESKMDLAESLVDLDKTVLLVCERAIRVLRAWQFVRKGKFREAARALGLSKRNFNSKTASNVWLELQYGWLPLLNDIYSAVEVTKDLFGDPLKHHTYTKRRVSDGLWCPGIGGDSTVWEAMSSTGAASVEVETKFRFRVDNALLAYIAGFQLTNPLYIFWVAMPFTFIVDWFLPIGDWLGSLTATHGLTFVDGYQTTKTFASVVAEGNRKPHYNAYWTKIRHIQAAQSRMEIGYLRRVPLYGWPLSRTYFRFPFTSPQRIASAIALTHATARLR